MPSVVSTAVLVLGTAAVYAAGLEKARNLSPLRETLHALGFAPRRSHRLAVGVVVVELATVAVVVGAGPGAIGAALFLAMGIAFAAAGARALGSDRAIPCACFGSSGGVLGWRQLLALPLWIAVAAAALSAPGSTVSRRALVLAAGAVALAAARAYPALRGWRGARNDRRALAGA